MLTAYRPPYLFTSQVSAVSVHFLFWRVLLSSQNMKTLQCLYDGYLIHFTYALVRSSAFRPEIASCQGIPQTGLSLNNLPSGAKVSWNKTRCLVKTFRWHLLPSAIVLSVGTDNPMSCEDYYKGRRKYVTHFNS